MYSPHIYNSIEKSRSKIHYTILVCGLHLVIKIFLVFVLKDPCSLISKQTKQEDAQHTTRDSQFISVHGLVYHSHFGI